MPNQEFIRLPDGRIVPIDPSKTGRSSKGPRAKNLSRRKGGRSSRISKGKAAQQKIDEPRIKIQKALKDLEVSRSVRPGLEPDFEDEKHSFARTGHPNSFQAVSSFSSEGATKKIGAYDKEGKLVGTFDTLTEGPNAGAFKVTVREDAQGSGWGKRLLTEAENQGIDVVASIPKNSFTSSGRSLLRSWLEGKEKTVGKV